MLAGWLILRLIYAISRAVSRGRDLRVRFPSMPELPEIEVLRRSLEPHLPGDRIVRVEVRNRELREPVATRTLARLAGRSILGLRRRATHPALDPPAAPPPRVPP